ncbi:hypothetical protein [Ammoniphilus sp. CFH 90114]|uniref:hypothetical protein n=1 Tax=Ammoniphilus sp. CFH 90114 TaxID=2493665 RepID=UPI00100F16BA|nr:hypothetical protein [Ammoniphilus sp. CFH 90114]RXT14940.1 hypothetical protein EIZ39_01655 [Ammoniphilus sp. CFH 90114]
MVDLIELIEEFEVLIASSETNHHKMLTFLKGVNRRLPKNVIPPMIEFITILKEENPSLFYELKDHIPKGMPLYDILRIDISYELAKERLTKRKERVRR